MMQCFRYCVNTGGAGSEIVRESKVVMRLPSESGGCDRWLRRTLLLARVTCKDRTSLLAFFLHLHTQLSAIKINPRYSALAAVEGPNGGVHDFLQRQRLPLGSDGRKGSLPMSDDARST
jgi:hypothetical protein